MVVEEADAEAADAVAVSVAAEAAEAVEVSCQSPLKSETK